MIDAKRFLSKILKTALPQLEKPKRVQVTRAPRIAPEALHGISFIRSDSGAPAPVRVDNISAGGIGLGFDSQDRPLEPGSVIEGALKIAGKAFEVELRVAHSTAGYAGCAFVEPPRAMVVALHQALAAELAASQMTYVGPDKLNSEKDGTPHWYHGAETELYLVEKDYKVLRFHFVCFGNYIEGAEGKPLRFGHVIEDDDTSKPSYKGSDLVRWDSAVDEDTVAMVTRLVRHIPKLPPIFRDGILGLIG